MRMLRVLWPLMIIAYLGPVSAVSDRPDVITNASLELEEKVPLKTARAIFTMRLRSWPDGTPVRVFVLPDQHPIHQAFCREVLKTFPYQIRQVWDRSVFTGTGQAPIVVEDENELRTRVANTPGAIGYIAGITLPEAELETLDTLPATDPAESNANTAAQIKVLTIK